ncbi:alpha/beta fold hydrolase [Actinacidiphila oryziradicis]|uniref:Alpha/beta hydrolase n=1 Tax=Actinacidiphila oryziradicis TaxID=2571141 RepID=A0A4U0RSW3_9ACTN|nr:alpha/beta hydrolase [Actinacidiphila oryziradicis]TJZ99169.1 alpha/beta hydrolase [Actinacidiphila oryziradicis]
MLDPARFPAAYDALLARWPVPVESADVPTAYGTTRVNSCGPADAPPLMLLPGGGATSTVWLADVERLSARHRVHAVDTIGQAGRSAADGRPARSEADLMVWLDEVLAGLDVGRTGLCGHSYGAWLSLCYALHAPERVSGAVLLDPTRCFAGYRAGYLLKAAPLFLRPSRQAWHRFLGWETGGATVDEGWAELAALGAEQRWGKIVDPRPPAAERLRGCEVPMLVVLAARSRAHDAAAVGERAKALLPRVRTHVLPTATHHTLPLAHADELDSLILDFLA